MTTISIPAKVSLAVYGCQSWWVTRSKDLKMMTHQHNICTSRVNPFFSKINGPTRYIVPRRISTPPYAPDLSRSMLDFLKKHPQNFHKIHQTSFFPKSVSQGPSGGSNSLLKTSLENFKVQGGTYNCHTCLDIAISM